ncbi:hypothetical protein I2F27_06150 [Acinetobacter sp. B5B]|uniref:hypothetical protein n=1 Tax=Acinetobacter baretiae TaxID=2605383 RepID=UPI0018C2211A|nr:hypothetical protein [Acinetobacter baretiae]MBF7682909.1 hypothetical protein [Acinetobacter baretiae]
MFLPKNLLAIIFLLITLVGCTTETPENKTSYVTLIDGELPEINANPLLNLNLSVISNIHMFKQEHQTFPFILNINGQLVQINKDGTLKHILNEGDYSEKEIQHLKYNEDALSSENFIYVNSSNNILEAITPNNEHVLIAGKFSDLAHSSERFINQKNIQNPTTPLNQATFNLPIGITESTKNEWVVLDNNGEKLRLITPDHTISDLPMPNSFKAHGIHSNQDGTVWLFNDTSVFQYHIAQRKIIKQWQDQFEHISDLSVSSLGVFIIESLKSHIKKLNQSGNFENFFQSVCDSDYLDKHHRECNPLLDHYDDSLRFSPLHLIAHPEKNELIISTYFSVYTLSLTKKLERIAGTKENNIDKTDQEITKKMQGCTNLYANQDGAYCYNGIYGLNFYKNNQTPRQLFDHKYVGQFIVYNNNLYSISYDTIIKSPLTNKIDNYEQSYRDVNWFNEISDTEVDDQMQPRSIVKGAESITVDEQGNLFIADADSYKIFQISPDKKVSTLISFSDSDPEKTPIVDLKDDDCRCRAKYNKKPKLVSVKGDLGYVVDGYYNIYKIDLKSKSYTILYNANKDTPSFKSISIDSNNNPWLLTDSKHLYSIQEGHLVDFYQKLIELGYPEQIGIDSIAFSSDGNLLLGSHVALFKADMTKLIH